MFSRFSPFSPWVRKKFEWKLAIPTYTCHQHTELHRYVCTHVRKWVYWPHNLFSIHECVHGTWADMEILFPKKRKILPWSISIFPRINNGIWKAMCFFVFSFLVIFMSKRRITHGNEPMYRLVNLYDMVFRFLKPKSTFRCVTVDFGTETGWVDSRPQETVFLTP